MASMRIRWVAAGFAALLLASILVCASGQEVLAGELDIGCNLSFSIGCNWKPTGCHKPSPPYSFVSDARSYNSAVDDFNDYVQEIGRYKRCMLGEAKRDISDTFPEIVANGVKEEASKVDREAENERSMLQMKRPR